MPEPPPVMKIVLPVISFILLSRVGGIVMVYHVWAQRRCSVSSLRKRIAEHRPAALGLLASRLVLDDVPMLDEDPVLDPEDVCRDPVHGRPEPGEATMHYDEVAVSDDQARLVSQR